MENDIIIILWLSSLSIFIGLTEKQLRSSHHLSCIEQESRWLTSIYLWEIDRSEMAPAGVLGFVLPQRLAEKVLGSPASPG